MDLEDDDEFGDLYSDVLLDGSGASTTSPVPPPPPMAATPARTFPSAGAPPFSFAAVKPPSQSEDHATDQSVAAGVANESPGGTQVTHLEGSKADREEDWILGPAPIPEDPALDWDDDDDTGSVAATPSGIPKITTAEKEAVAEEVPATTKQEIGAAAAISIPLKPKDTPPLVGEPSGTMGIEDGIGDLDAEQAIPGLDAAPIPGLFPRSQDENSRASRSDEWDSDSEDDIQIVLNDDNLVRLGRGPAGSDDDEDGDDLVIVADDAQHLHHQAVEEQDWGDESIQPGLDAGKDGSDVAKGGLGVGGIPGSRAGYGHGFHPQHHSQFKYVRPGAATLPGGAVVGSMGGTAQVRPQLGTGMVGGRGRGMQKGFHSGYGPSWAGNSSARPFGGGLEFTLPSHKTIFDVNIDAFEEKPWTHPASDLTDFFNFELNEESWKDVCKKLEQHRLEATMQTKIRVYESGRSEQDYDPDLPPELAAATGVQELPAESNQPGRMVSGQSDLFGQEMGAAQRRVQLPTGRAIQVETGYGERLPSMDTRPPRMRDSDAIIEIVPQDFEDDSAKPDAALEHHGKDSSSSDNPSGYKSEANGHDDSEDSKRHLSHKGRKLASSEVPSSGSHESSLPGKTDVSPSNLRDQFEDNHKSVKVKSTLSSEEVSRQLHDSRVNCRPSTSGPSNDALHSQNGEPEALSNDSNKIFHKTSDVSPTVTEENEQGPDSESGDEHGDTLELGGTDVENEDLASVHLSGDTCDDNDSPSSVKKLKLNSRVEQLACLESSDADDIRKIHSNNSTRRDEKDYGKRVQGGEDEATQSSSSRPGNARKHHNDETFPHIQKEDHGQSSRHELARREDFHRSRPHREADAKSGFAGKNNNLEKPKGRDASGAYIKREEDVHGIRIKEKDNKRERIDDIGARHRPKHRLSDRKDRDVDLCFRKSVDSSEQRSRLSRDVAGKNRERDESLMKYSDNLNDIYPKRRKVEEHYKRESIPKESLHGYRNREESSLDKRGGNDGSDHLSKEEMPRARDKMVSLHSARHREDSLRHSDRGDRQRLQQFNEDSHARREREDRSGARDSRLEDKPPSGNVKAKDDRRTFDVDSLSKDRRRHGNTKRNLIEEKARPQHRAREETHANDTQSTRDERRSRHGRQAGHNGQTLSSDCQNIRKEKNKDNLPKNKDAESNQNSLVLGKRKNENNGHRDEKCYNHADGKPETRPELYTKNKEEVASDDENENQQESRRGRSKLERWTSHRERDYVSSSIQSLSLLKEREAVDNTNVAPVPESVVEVNTSTTSDNRDFGSNSSIDKEERDRHLETVEKLKKRSERFNLPMPGEKESTSNKKNENESSARNESVAEDLEVKQERPARKRRWVSG